jgi:hypothetical protein
MLRPLELQTFRQGEDEIHDQVAAKSDVKFHGSVDGILVMHDKPV